jgi:hypothetical protein
MNNLSFQDPITIPVIIDDVKKKKKFDMSRCTYFSIQCDTPSPDRTLTIQNVQISFFMMGISGIIYSPADSSDRFDQPDKFEKIFEIIESHENLYIDINDIWIPNRFFVIGEQKRGSVYRLPLDVFSVALAFRENTASLKDLEKACGKHPKGAIFQDDETGAFSTWSKVQIDNAKKFYRSNPQKKLHRKARKP